MVERIEVHPDDRASWRAWLEAHHASSDTIWLVFWKKESGKRKLTYEEAVEEALCFGWIDGQLSSIDAHRYRQLFSRRKPKSVWSAINKGRLERLLAAGLVREAGLRAIEVAKDNGSWTSLDAIEAMEVPAALTAALAKRKKARTFFEGLSPGNRKGFLYFIGTPRTEAGRARRLEVALALLEGGHTLRDYYFSKGAAARLKERAGLATSKSRGGSKSKSRGGSKSKSRGGSKSKSKAGSKSGTGTGTTSRGGAKSKSGTGTGTGTGTGAKSRGRVGSKSMSK